MALSELVRFGDAFVVSVESDLVTGRVVALVVVNYSERPGWARLTATQEVFEVNAPTPGTFEWRCPILQQAGMPLLDGVRLTAAWPAG